MLINEIKNFFHEKITNLAYLILPEKKYIQIIYKRFFGENLNINQPKKFSEKIFLLKLINGKEQRELIRRCYDKYTAKEYVIEKLGRDKAYSILNKTYAVYNNVDEIKFDELPEKFVLKITQSSGFNVICVDKNNLNFEETKKKLNKWLKRVNRHQLGAESYYYDGKAKILCEELMQNSSKEIPYDIRVYCFNGKPQYFVIDIGTTLSNGQHGHNLIRNVYDRDWNFVDVNLGRNNDKNYHIDRPDNLEEIIYISEKLSKDFYFARIDLYNIDNKILKFGEITWIPMGGKCLISPKEFDVELGELLKIPTV